MSLWKNTLGKPSILIALGVVIAGGVMASMKFGGPQTRLAGSSAPAVMQPTSLPNPASIATLRDLDATFADISDTAATAVVHIRSGNEQAPVFAGGGAGGQGSGFIYRADGWIVTNHHVVSGFDEVTVVLNDGREFKGKVYPANDEQLDIAVVKIDATDLPTLTVANSNGVRPGQFAVAVGSPFGLENSVTIGHVSAINRPGLVNDARFGERGYTGMIQTDASINPGNSGGPLINIDGQLIGVNTTIFSTSGSNAGIGFAIPSNVVQVVADELIASKKFDRGYLGVAIDDMKPYQKKELKLAGGAIVSADPTAGSPGAALGLKKDDVITEIEGRPITNQLDLRVALYRHAPGESVDVTFVRNGQSKTQSVKLSEPVKMSAQAPSRNMSPDDLENFFRRDRNAPEREFFTPDQQPTPQTGRPILGVSVQDLDSTGRSQFGIPNTINGVLVMSVAPNSFAAKVGLQAGDVIESINSTATTTTQKLREAMSKVKWGETISVTYSRMDGGSASRNTIQVPFR